jgi:cell division septal protein FtsQ
MTAIDNNIEQQDEKTQRHSRRVYAGFGVIAVLAFVLWIVTLQWRTHLPVSSIEVEGEQIVLKDEIVKLAEVPLGTGLYDVDLTAIGQNVERNNFIKRAVVKRDAPSVLRIVVEERSPIALLSVPGINDMLLIDGDGFVLPHVATQAVFDIPVISGIDSAQSLRVGERTDLKDVQAALEILRASEYISIDLYHLISEVQLRGGRDIMLYTADAGVPVIFGRGDPAEKLVKFNAFWKQCVNQQGLSQLQYIDLRFDDQVVVANTAQKSL